ncbi:hypothetical protein ACIBCO_38115 [Streptomyces violascens]|uniref:hypothetical protein n=1 Tax=Streptomyces violascens TaxID=67381 RepID=UPI0037AE3862
MNELFAGYANYASTEAILEEQLTANGQDAPDSSLTVSVSASWSWSVTFTWTV